MEEILNICRTCLSTDRNLIPVYEMTTLLQYIHFEELKHSHGGVCWECHNMLLKFNRFKNRAYKAQKTLSKTVQNIKPLTTLTSKTNMLYDYEFIYTFDPLTKCTMEPKAEPESIKQEITDQNDDLDINTDFQENKIDFDVETEYIDFIETKHVDNLLRKQEFVNNCDDYLDNGIDLDESIPEINNKIYVDMIETKKKDNKVLKKQEGSNRVKFKNEKLDKVHVENLKQKTNEHKSKTYLEEDSKEFQEKFVRVVLSEEELLRVREEKRNQYNFKKIPFKCDSCVLGFTRKDTYSLHMRKKHDESVGNEICDVCSIRFRNTVALANHKRKHYFVYRCRLCKYEIHEFVSAMNHSITKHGADKPDSIHCSQCSIVVKTPDELEAHMQTDHSIFCECGVKFKDKSNLRQHISRAHSDLRDFICDICKKTFKTKTRLESHMVTHSGHIAKNLSYCQQCNIQYKNIRVYRNHLKSSANHSEGHPCSECNKKFRSKGYLRQHINFYHLRKSQYKCEVCNKIFISNWRLRNHKQQYHGLSRPRNHSCNTCAKTFFTLATLRSHQLTHSDQRSFMCEDCGDTFKQSAALYTHTRLVHKGGGTRKKRNC